MAKIADLLDTDMPPMYSTDVGRLGGYGNMTGQPASKEGGKEMMYPSAARTQLVVNPFFYEGGPLPQLIPADLYQMLIRQQSQSQK